MTALLEVMDNILTKQDSSRSTVLTLLDCSRAFDSINVSLSLSYYGLTVSTVQWFESYVGARLQTVKLSKCNGAFVFPEFLPVNPGVVQGFLLGHYYS